MTKEITKHRPIFSNLSEIHQALDQLFDTNLLELDRDFPAFQMTQWTPKIDIKDKDGQYLIQADLPGVNPKDIEITLENGILTIKGKKESETKEEKSNYVRIERSSGSFYRSFNLSDVSDASKITAKSKNGVLEIIIPKNDKSTSQKIQIKEE